MAQQSSSGWVTKALLGVCLVSLVAGIWTAASSHKATHTSKDVDSNDKMGLANNFIKRDHLLLVTVAGPISMEADSHGGNFLNEESNAVQARKALEKALKDDHVKGVLVRIDSPGGTVGMSQELNGALKRLVAAKKPVVASIGDLAASGGYYMACAADKIVANPGSLTGSIGVILNTLNFKGLMVDKLGVKAITIKSGKFKDILSPYRDTTPEEISLLQKLINVSYQQFLHAVIEGRTRHIKDPAEKAALASKITAIADGRVLVSEEAKQVGLVDEIGDATDARKLLNQLAKQENGAADNLPLEESDGENRLLDWIGITSLAPKGPSLSLPIPFSAMHPNQPLWMFE